MAKKKVEVVEEEVVEELEEVVEEVVEEALPEVSAPKLQCLKPDWETLLPLHLSKINHSHVEKNAINGLVRSLIYS